MGRVSVAVIRVSLDEERLYINEKNPSLSSRSEKRLSLNGEGLPLHIDI